MNSRLHETEKLDGALGLRQGDLIRLTYAPGSDPNLAPIGVVINADCDLANRKHDGVIAYLPIFPFAQYLRVFWSGSFVDSSKSSLTKDIASALSLDSPWIESLTDWLIQSEVSDVVEKLKLEFDPKLFGPSIIAKLDRLKICVGRSSDPFEVFVTLCRREKDPHKYARNQLNDARKSLGEGHFFISDILGEPEIGFVIRIRRIFSLPEECCFNSESEMLSSSREQYPSAIRFGRLSPLYRFRLVQLFANQFSRVGLPDDLTRLSDLAIDSVLAAHFGG